MAWEEPRKTGMEYRRLGNTGLHVSALGLGGWLTFGGHVDDERAFACMKQAYDLGINFFDTAENYSGGKSEEVMGRAIKHFGWKRSDLVISTKINGPATANGEILANNHGLSRKHVLEGLEASLARLGLRYVDVVYAHRPDRLTPVEETVRAFNHVIDKGQALYWGTSEWAADEIAEAVGVARELGLIAPVVEQPFYNILERTRVESEYQRLYTSRHGRPGLGLTTFSPQNFGLLSGKYDDAAAAPSSSSRPPEDSRFGASDDPFARRARDGWASDGDAAAGTISWRAKAQKALALKPLADRLGASRSQLAVAWCLRNPNVASVITGASRPEQIVENVGAVALAPRLTPDVMAEIDEIVGLKITPDPARQG